VIVVIFFLGRTRLARKIIELIPESVVGPIFNRLRLSWKGMSKPAKRKGLGHLEMDIR
jgi:coenzyme F420 hydrogenase subunit beta